ncbi:hypothetical protein RHSIM_Rhsim13G0144200 [Rhododendron simsii]|uniref:Protein FAR1-RELATED SEQUENCE n=1 Tax=Rhododendron simsii TaxID=118357 RepID=A0A834G5F6_RHOSS|nr:hypothetical protein RHSIM_Rhsim13G0144200 [Rhododendron simsii]
MDNEIGLSKINDKDEEAFNEAWKLVELLYKDKEKVLDYIRNTWFPFKERFVHAWTENCAHFGNRVSSRAEGAHGKLKKYLQVSIGDLYQVKNKICLAIENEFKEITTQLSSERIPIPHNCNNYFFKELITKVSSFALRKLVDQYEMLKHGTMKSTCTGHFMASMGLPCAHKMIDWKGKVLPLDAIHSQWRIDTRSFAFSDGGETRSHGQEFKKLVHELENKYQEWPASQRECVQERISQLISPSLPLVIEPNILPHKERPSGSKKVKESSSTRRNASKFEIVDATRKCSICKGVGHNS